jgi:hypothetical protein
MTKISRREQIQERRHRVWELHCQGFTQTEIANNFVHYPPRTVCRDIALVKKARDLERKRKADLQEYESREVLDEVRTSMQSLNRQAHIDFESLDLKDDRQREWRLAMYEIITQIEDSRVELALMSDGLEQREALLRMKVKTDSLANQLRAIEENRLSGSSNNTNGSLQEESTIV